MVSEPTLLGLKSMVSANKMRRLKYSCEEVYERMDNGLCIFCDELDTPGHHDLKHKGIQIFIVDDDLACNDVEEVHQIHQAVKNPDPFVEPVKNPDALIEPLDCASVLQVLDSVSDVLMVHKVDSPVKEVEESSQQSTNGNDKIVAHQLLDQMPNACQKDLTVIESSNKEVLSFSHKDARVWESGGLPTKMDHWDWFEKELKLYGESHKAATFLYSQMQVVKSNPVEFKTCDRKRSNKTLPLADEQDDEHEQNQVLKLISSWNNRIWEPGGELIEPDKWNWLEKCYNHGILMRLMHWLSSMWWKETKSKEFDRLSACSCVDLKTWHCVKHETQQTDFHVWHRWMNKAEKLIATSALLELMMLGLVSFQPNKGNDVVGLVPKTTVLREVSYCRSNDYGTIRHKLLLVRDTSSDGYKAARIYYGIIGCWIDKQFERRWSKMIGRFEHNENDWIHSLVDTNYCEIPPDKTHVKLQEMSCFLSEKSLVEFVGYKAHGRELLVVGVTQLTLAARKFHLKHKWRSRLLQSFSELKQRIIVSLWKSLGYLMEAHGSKYEGLVYVLERKKLRNIEDDINHLKKLLATLEGLALKISCGLLCGDGKFHLKHKWKSRLIQAPSGLQFGVDNIVLFTSPDKMLYSNNHKLLHPETGFCTQYNDLELLNTEHQTSPGLNYFTYLSFIWKQVLNCGCEAGHVSSRIFSIGGVHGFEAQRKRLLVLNEIPLLENHNKVDLTIEENWFYNKPMIIKVFHLQRPPELIDIQGNPNFITKVPVQLKEHPPDQFFSSFYGQVLML